MTDHHVCAADLGQQVGGDLSGDRSPLVPHVLRPDRHAGALNATQSRSKKRVGQAYAETQSSQEIGPGKEDVVDPLFGLS
ncbi:hypothetical protein SHO565_42190 [Streptomyces sp. HO565]